MSYLKKVLHLLSDIMNSLLLLYALLVEKDYTIALLVLVLIVVSTKVIADIID